MGQFDTSGIPRYNSNPRIFPAKIVFAEAAFPLPFLVKTGDLELDLGLGLYMTGSTLETWNPGF